MTPVRFKRALRSSREQAERYPWIARRVARRPSKQKGPPRWSGPHVLCRRRQLSPYVGHTLLSFRFGRSGGLRGQLKHGRLLAFEQLGQEHHLPIGKFKGIM